MSENPYESPSTFSISTPKGTVSAWRHAGELALYGLAAVWFWALGGFGVGNDFVQLAIWVKLLLTAATATVGGGAAFCWFRRIQRRSEPGGTIYLAFGAAALAMFCPCSGLGTLVMWVWN